MSKIVRIEKNKIGEDYFVGDIHGCFTLLEIELTKIGFNKSKDRLFALGDLVDRGPDSYLAVEYADEPWFVPLMGNHDAFTYWLARYMIREERGEPTKGFAELDCAHAVKNGGSWIMMQPASWLQAYVRMVEAMPIAIEYRDEKGKVLAGMVHAELQQDMNWMGLKKLLKVLPHDYVFSTENDDEDPAIESAIWGRSRYKTANKMTLAGKQHSDLQSEGIPLVISGHTPVPHDKHQGPMRIGNARIIDHGIYRHNPVVIYTLNQLL
jgi:serine/threonine protein phosphatase 1